MHSRMAFMSSTYLQDLKFEVIFALNHVCIVNVVTRPRKWPSFKSQSIANLEELKNIEWWRIVRE